MEGSDDLCAVGLRDANPHKMNNLSPHAIRSITSRPFPRQARWHIPLLGSVLQACLGTVPTAWSAAGIIGPQLVAFLKDHCPHEAATYTFTLGSGLLSIGFLVSLSLSPKTVQNHR